MPSFSQWLLALSVALIAMPAANAQSQNWSEAAIMARMELLKSEIAIIDARSAATCRTTQSEIADEDAPIASVTTQTRTHCRYADSVEVVTHFTQAPTWMHTTQVYKRKGRIFLVQLQGEERDVGSYLTQYFCAPDERVIAVWEESTECGMDEAPQPLKLFTGRSQAPIQQVASDWLKE